MKASELIKEIVKLAEKKFKCDMNNPFDTISVCLYPAHKEIWVAYLFKPNEKEVKKQYTHEFLLNNKSLPCEGTSHFYVECDTMIGALETLCDLLCKTPMKYDAIPLYGEIL